MPTVRLSSRACADVNWLSDGERLLVVPGEGRARLVPEDCTTSTTSDGDHGERALEQLRPRHVDLAAPRRAVSSPTDDQHVTASCTSVARCSIVNGVAASAALPRRPSRSRAEAHSTSTTKMPSATKTEAVSTWSMPRSVPRMCHRASLASLAKEQDEHGAERDGDRPRRTSATRRRGSQPRDEDHEPNRPISDPVENRTRLVSWPTSRPRPRRSPTTRTRQEPDHACRR